MKIGGINHLTFSVEEKEIPREEFRHSYTHIAFTVSENELLQHVQRLQQLGVTILPGRERNERDANSVYFVDTDGHKFEFHTGTREERIQCYKDEKKHMAFFE